ncbi:hypothetical protein V1511DRAFT_501209 [Dipodascopsis uninucleata]
MKDVTEDHRLLFGTKRLDYREPKENLNGTPSKKTRIEIETPTRRVLKTIQQSSSGKASTLKRRFKSLTEIASENDDIGHDPVSKLLGSLKDAEDDVNEDNEDYQGSTQLSIQNKMMDLLMSEDLDVTLDKEREIEDLKAALLWRHKDLQNEIESLQRSISQEEESSRENPNLTLNDNIHVLLTSNDKLCSRLELLDVKAIDMEKHRMPHMPVPQFDLENLRRFTDLTIDLIDTSFVVSKSVDDFGNESLARISNHMIAVKHDPSQLNTMIRLVVNQSSLEVLSFEVSCSTIQPLWAKAPLTGWADVLQMADDVRRNDISCFLFGISELGRLSRIRTEIFVKIARTFPEYLTIRRVLNLNTNKQAIDDKNDTDDDEQFLKKPMSVEEEFFWIGQSRIVLQGDSDNSIRLVISWDIILDPSTGDGSSIVTANTSIPEIYEEADEDNIMPQISEVFNALVKDRGVYRASCIIIRNLLDID